MEVLYVGSGKSATKIGEFREGRTVCAVNNAWRLLQPGDYWIHTGDMPLESRPPESHSFQPISYPEYGVTSRKVCKRLGIETVFPEHHLGYTIFFQGLYWITEHLKPETILLLGFDHDYNPAKLDRWKQAGSPAPHNLYNGKPERTSLEKWSNRFFRGLEPDFFYGHGTPDPVRLGEDALKALFEQARDKFLPQLGVKCFNASGVTTGLNTFPQLTN